MFEPNCFLLDKGLLFRVGYFLKVHFMPKLPPKWLSIDIKSFSNMLIFESKPFCHKWCTFKNVLTYKKNCSEECRFGLNRLFLGKGHIFQKQIIFKN